MAETVRGPMCSTRCGPGWIDDGTMCLTRTYPWGPVGVQRHTKSAATPTMGPKGQAALKPSASRRTGNIPSLQDCKRKMQSHLPKAHNKAIEMLSHTVRFFSNVFKLVASRSSLDDVARQIGRDGVRFLAASWGIYVNPLHREKKGMEPRPSKAHLAREILQPISHILAVYQTIKSALEKGNFNYECEYKGDSLYTFKCGSKGHEATGYVHSLFGNPFGDIHICVDELPNVDDISSIAENIIHEASHRFAGTDDDSTVRWKNAHSVESGMPTRIK